MKLFIESDDAEEIRRCLDYYPIDGAVIHSADGAKKIRDVIGEDRELHIPIERLRAEETAEEARRVVGAAGTNTYIGIALGAEGLRAMKLLDSSEVPFAAVGVRTSMQALMAGKCGASYVVPFVNRLDVRNAVSTVEGMSAALRNNGLETELLAARFKTTRQAIELAEYGISALRVPPSMLPLLLVD